MSPLIIAIVGAVLLVLFIAMFILSRIKVAGPNEAFIVTGRKGRAVRAADGTMVTDLSGQKVVMGAAVFRLGDIGPAGTSLQHLGRPEAARILRAAAIAEAQARQTAETERMKAEEAIAESARNLSLKQAAVQAEIDAAKARSAAAGPLAEAERQQAILTEQQTVAERNAELKERQLDTEVRKPADAARYKSNQEADAARNTAVLRADAERQATIAAAQATAEQARLIGEGERARRGPPPHAHPIRGAQQGGGGARPATRHARP